MDTATVAPPFAPDRPPASATSKCFSTLRTGRMFGRLNAGRGRELTVA